MLEKAFGNSKPAYNIDKAVEKLKELEGIQFDGENESYQLNWCIETNKAIEIVKQGGVSDVVCEWKKSKDYPFDWLVGCDGCEVNHRQGDYCPRCGKKIKVLE